MSDHTPNGYYVYYPRGFRRFVQGQPEGQLDGSHRTFKGSSGFPETNEVHGDKEINELWEQYTRSGVDSQDWEFVQCVLHCAHRLLPNHSIFYKQQQANRRLHGRNFEFLFEMEHYLIHGKCKILSPINALALLERSWMEQTVPTQRKVPVVDRSDRLDIDTLRWIDISEDVGKVLEYLFVLFGKSSSL